MDPVSASSYNLSVCQEATTQSITSLSNFEKRSLKTLLPQIIATCISTCNHIAVGVSLAYSAILIPQLQNKNSDIKVTESECSWLASVVPLIAPIGSMLAGYVMDKIGRINTLKLSVVPGVIGWVMIATATNLPVLLLGRIFGGLCSTLSTSPAIVYLTEIARKDMRGSLIAMGPTFVSLGMVITYLKGWLINWRLIAWTCNFYIVIPFFLLFLIPESPAWLVSKGKLEEARKSLNWLHKYQPPYEGKSFADLQLDLLVKEKQTKQEQVGNFWLEFLKPSGYKPLLIISGVFLFQQYSGIYIFLFYSVTFFEAVGTSINPYISSIWIGVIRLIMSLLNTWMLKYFTRRKLIMLSASLMCLCTLVSGIFTLWIRNGTTEQTWVPVIFLLFYVISSMIGVLTIPWTMTAELFPLKIRSAAHTTATCIVNFIMFVTVQTYLDMQRFLGGSHGIQLFFSVVCGVMVIFSFFFLPETHGKKLTEIEEYFQNNTIYLGQKKRDDKKECNTLLKHSCDK